MIQNDSPQPLPWYTMSCSNTIIHLYQYPKSIIYTLGIQDNNKWAIIANIQAPKNRQEALDIPNGPGNAEKITYWHKTAIISSFSTRRQKPIFQYGFDWFTQPHQGLKRTKKQVLPKLLCSNFLPPSAWSDKNQFSPYPENTQTPDQPRSPQTLLHSRPSPHGLNRSTRDRL